MQQRAQSSFKFKTNYSASIVLQLLQGDLSVIASELAEAIERAPNFFQHSPLLLDLEKIQDINNLDFVALKKLLLQHKIVPIGICNANSLQVLSASQADLPNVQLQRTQPESQLQSQQQPVAVKTWQATKIISQPIRSGMQIYAHESDLIITAPVSPGAEIMADGNIHVYAPMRGRMLAGVSGNTNAQIFCQQFDAELVSIGGYYLTKEEMQHFSKHQGIIHIYLNNEQIYITTISA